MEYPCIFLHMWEPFRQQLISNHKFYVEQAQKRLLSQFEDISGEADKYAEEWLSRASQWFDPDRHDPDDFQVQAYDESIDFYGLLTDMHNQTRLSVIAGMYHEWDKQLRDWISGILINHCMGGRETKTAIWKATFDQILDLLKCFDWQVREQPYFAQIDACRLVVNAYKHGLGDSLIKLKRKYPQFLKDILGGGLPADELDPFLDYTHLKVVDEDLATFSNAIIAFWN
ncbi:MAG: hypothetical protein KC588_18340, partial [Nitrospira sp.]|nr:hypothetical protein [Nitrospira sp.]